MARRFQDEIIRSPNDSRTYRLIWLENGLSALLIHESSKTDEDDLSEGENPSPDRDETDSGMSDASSDGGSDSGAEDGSKPDTAEGKQRGVRTVAAGCLSVGVGSLCDPSDVQGLAHLLEHMMFMGTEDFPDENDFDAFFMKHGGSTNAYTDAESTTFIFEINHRYLRPALARFAAVFRSPTLRAEALEREVKAVDDEFQGVLQSDSTRVAQLLLSSCNPKHPCSQLSWGNMESIWKRPQANNVDIRARVADFHQAHYCASVMNLVVLGRESLDTLEEWVTDFFSSIPVRRSPKALLPYQMLKEPWAGPQTFGVNVDVLSVKERSAVRLSWPLPSQRALYRTRPSAVVSHIVGHEAHGSLLHYLKQRGWGTKLVAGVGTGGFETNSIYSLFEVDITLTEDGFRKRDEVVDAVFAYLNLLRGSEIPPWVFKELKLVDDFRFRFRQDPYPYDYVVELVEGMNDGFAPADIVCGSCLYFEYDAQGVADVLARLTPSNVRVEAVSKSFADSLPHREPWFGVEHNVAAIDPSTMERWASIRPFEGMSIPAQNPFLPSDFSLRPSFKTPHSRPVILEDNEHFRLWVKKDEHFKVPRLIAHFHILNSVTGLSAKEYARTVLYAALVRDALQETSYMAEMADLGYKIYVTMRGLHIAVFGFNDKVPALLSVVTEAARTLCIKEDRFAVIQEEVLRQYRNSLLKPRKLANHDRLLAISECTWLNEEKIEALTSATRKSLQEFAVQLWSQQFVEALVVGNVTASEAVALAEIVVPPRVMRSNCLLPVELRHNTIGVHWLPRTLPLPVKDAASDPNVDANRTPAPRQVVEEEAPQQDGFGLVDRHLDFRCVNTNPNDPRGAVMVYFQCCVDDIWPAILLTVLETLLQEPFFDTLRTREQLGYSVDCTQRMSHGLLGITMCVESSAHSVEYVRERIARFLYDFEARLRDYPADDFSDHVDSLIEHRRREFSSLEEETERYWEEIYENYYLFDRQEREIAALQRVKRCDVLDFYRRYIVGKLVKDEMSFMSINDCSPKRLSTATAETSTEDMHVRALTVMVASCSNGHDDASRFSMQPTELIQWRNQNPLFRRSVKLPANSVAAS